MGDTVFQCKNLTKTYKETIALDHVDLELKRGHIYGLIGNNGAGKTTLMRIMLGINFPTDGEFSLFGDTQETRIVKNRARIGAILENPFYNEMMSGKNNLEYLRRLYGTASKQDIDRVLELFGLADKAKIAVRHYSMGMKQRLSLAGALLNHPEFLVLDEPINGLDPSGMREIRELLLKLNREENITMLISSHYLEQLYQLATDYIFIDHGKIIQEVTLEELEKRCERFISIETEQLDLAVSALKEFHKEIQIEVYPEKHEIRISNYYGRPQQLTSEMVLRQVEVKKISSAGMGLEEYFNALIGGGSNV